MLSEEDFAIIADLDDIPIVLNPDLGEFYIKVLPNATDSFLYLLQEQNNFSVEVSND